MSRPIQLRLNLQYEGYLDYTARWVFEHHGLDEAVDHCIVLLNEALADPPLRDFPILFYDVAALKMGLTNADMVPKELTKTHDRNVSMICDQRFQIREKIEDQTGLHLAFVDEFGRSTLNTQRPTMGFVLRESDAGKIDNLKNLRLGIGKTKAAIQKDPQIIKEPVFRYEMHQLNKAAGFAIDEPVCDPPADETTPL